jgi:hypothetical protein
MKKVFSPFIEFGKYPGYIIEKTIELIKNEFVGSSIPVKNLKYFEKIENMGYFSQEIIEILLDKIINNPKKTGTFDFTGSTDELNENIIQIFDKIKIASNFMQFLRFFLRNQIDNLMAQTLTPQTITFIINKLMLYTRFGEIPIQEYLRFKVYRCIDLMNQGHILDAGICTDFTTNPAMIFDAYYIELVGEADRIKSSV